jgi:hypothetical protein
MIPKGVKGKSVNMIPKGVKGKSVNMIPKGVKGKHGKVISESFQNMAPEQGVGVIADKIEKQMQLPATPKCNTSVQDFNTYSAGKDYHGYDVAGCRYDLENKTQNGTMYGPPLSWCATYGNTGLPVPFYPLNG